MEQAFRAAYEATLLANDHSAGRQIKTVVEQIKEFENSLDDKHQLVLLVLSAGQFIPMIVQEIGYCSSDIIVIKGVSNGEPAVLVQNVSQLSFLMQSYPIENPTVKKAPIGYKID